MTCLWGEQGWKENLTFPFCKSSLSFCPDSCLLSFAAVWWDSPPPPLFFFGNGNPFFLCADLSWTGTSSVPKRGSPSNVHVMHTVATWLKTHCVCFLCALRVTFHFPNHRFFKRHSIYKWQISLPWNFGQGGIQPRALLSKARTFFLKGEPSF